ncbi:hypothetical protein N825_34355 [Skermanella stibiiresistens SB22]|uniref:Peptidase M10 serralysin C-terminal domain-containing protein n=1 Tax=Skermanella stibiiresistens SB22 TaxID=1385369 RepID=W9GPG9_9PROT|nr:hypothetical protein N825_34355 [Skermanella stibiiresistens SB22]
MLNGSTENDYLAGLAGDDIILGAGGYDALEGGAGDDTLNGGTDGQFGDTVGFSSAISGVIVNLALGTANDGEGGTDTLIGIEHVDGSRYNDTLIGDNRGNWFRPMAGDDMVDGAGGSDDVMYEFTTQGITVDLGAGTASGAEIGTDTLTSIENVHAGNGADTIIGWDEDGYVFARDGDDQVFGGGGADTLIGGSGTDMLDGGDGFDTVTYSEDGYYVAGPDTSGVCVNLSQEEVSFNNRLVAPGTAVDNWGYIDTIIAIERLEGSTYADLLIGDALTNSLSGGGGDDRLDGGDGNDILIGGSGADFLDGGQTSSDDRISYLNDPAGIVADFAARTVKDGWGAIDTFQNVEYIVGSNFNDRITGVDAVSPSSAGRWNLDGMGGNDIVTGGNQSDDVEGGGGDDTLDGGAGFDEIDYDGSPTGVHVDLGAGKAFKDGWGGTDTITNFEQLRGSYYSDLLIGSARGENLNAESGDDILMAGAGDDILRGAAGNDTLDGGSGDDSLFGGAGDDLIIGDSTRVGNAIDEVDYRLDPAGVVVDLSRSTWIVQDGFGGLDTLWNIGEVKGSEFDDLMTGSALGDRLGGYGGNDKIQAGAGDDWLSGGPGNDTLDGGAGFDMVDFFWEATQGVSVTLSTNETSVTDTLGATNTFISIEGVRGSVYADTLIGSTGNNNLDGADGDDTLNGGAGADSMAGGLGDDVYYVDDVGDSVTELANQGADTVRSSVSVSFSTQHVERIELTGTAAINANGNALVNTLIGNGANNILNASSGNDSLSGGLGNDILIGGAGTDQLEGGGGADVFDFNAISESAVGTARDVIKDFLRSTDKIDFSTIDADTSVDGNQAFSFIGAGAFTSTAGHLRFASGLLQGDVNGDQIADIEVSVVGVTTAVANDFVL